MLLIISLSGVKVSSRSGDVGTPILVRSSHLGMYWCACDVVYTIIMSSPTVVCSNIGLLHRDSFGGGDLFCLWR